MITLSRLNGQVVAINPDLITWIEVTPDTTVSLLGGDKIIVRESLDDVIGRIIEFRNAINSHDGTPTAYPPSSHVFEGVAAKRERLDSQRPSMGPRHHSQWPRK